MVTFPALFVSKKRDRFHIGGKLTFCFFWKKKNDHGRAARFFSSFSLKKNRQSQEKNPKIRTKVLKKR